MGGLAHYIEEEGLATTQISLIREHSEIIKPPRALWVPFELGRPLGIPGDASFQTKVLKSALKLLEASEGPLLVDFPQDAPSSTGGPQLVCPVAFESVLPEMTSADQLLEAFKKEAANISTWHEIALRKPGGRSTTGITGLSLGEIVDFLALFIKGNRDSSPLPDVPVPTALRMAAEDLKAFYFEGLAAQPGVPGDSTARANWFWGETIAARVINTIREICLGMQDNDFQFLGKLLLVPRNQLHRFR